MEKFSTDGTTLPLLLTSEQLRRDMYLSFLLIWYDTTQLTFHIQPPFSCIKAVGSRGSLKAETTVQPVFLNLSEL
jgi:hypothetical protein